MNGNIYEFDRHGASQVIKKIKFWITLQQKTIFVSNFLDGCIWIKGIKYKDFKMLAIWRGNGMKFLFEIF